MKGALRYVRDVLVGFCVLFTIVTVGFLAVHFDSAQKILRTAYLMEKVYLGEPDEEKSVDGVVAGMLDSLGDRYTAYLPKSNTITMMQQVSGNVYGIGVYVSENENNEIVFIATIPEGPAEEAGIQAGDKLVAVDGISTVGMTMDDATAILRGAADTMVKVEVERDGERHTFDVKRYKIGTVKTVAGALLEDHPEIAYIKIRSFSAQTAKEFAELANSLREEGYQGMILDLRDNGGGEVNAAISLARVFVDKGPIVHVVYGNGKVTTRSATGAQLAIPLVVLVNENTASASEIFSAAIKESGSGTLVGTKTFGKGLVQGIYFYRDGSAAKVTEAKYLTPNQNDINGIGITPDIQVKQTNDSQDAQLERAVQVIQKKLNTV